DVRAALSERRREPIDAVDAQFQLAVDIEELPRAPVAAALFAIFRIDEVAEHRIVELNAVGSRRQDIECFFEQDLLDGAQEVFARRIDRGGMLRRVEATQDDVGAGQTDLDGTLRLTAEKRGTVGRDRTAPAQRRDGSRPQARAS